MAFSLDQFYRLNRRVLIWIVLFVLLWLLRDFFGLIFMTFLLTFFSAEAELGQSGVVRLQSTLSQLSDTRKKLLFTHTPPIDPLGPRDDGFESQLEGARTLSAVSGGGAHDHDGRYALQNHPHHDVPRHSHEASVRLT